MRTGTLFITQAYEGEYTTSCTYRLVVLYTMGGRRLRFFISYSIIKNAAQSQPSIHVHVFIYKKTFPL